MKHLLVSAVAILMLVFVVQLFSKNTLEIPQRESQIENSASMSIGHTTTVPTNENTGFLSFLHNFCIPVAGVLSVPGLFWVIRLRNRFKKLNT